MKRLIALSLVAGSMLLGVPAAQAADGYPEAHINGRTCELDYGGTDCGVVTTSSSKWSGKITIDFTGAMDATYQIYEDCYNDWNSEVSHGSYAVKYHYDGTPATAIYHSPTVFTSPSVQCSISVQTGLIETWWVNFSLTRSPSVPRSVHTTVSSHRATEHWYAPSANGGVAIDRYQVQRGTATSTRRSVAATSRSALFTGLTNGHKYKFYVRAHNRFGYSRWAYTYGTPHA